MRTRSLPAILTRSVRAASGDGGHCKAATDRSVRGQDTGPPTAPPPPSRLPPPDPPGRPHRSATEGGAGAVGAGRQGNSRTPVPVFTPMARFAARSPLPTGVICSYGFGTRSSPPRTGPDRARFDQLPHPGRTDPAAKPVPRSPARPSPGGQPLRGLRSRRPAPRTRCPDAIPPSERPGSAVGPRAPGAGERSRTRAEPVERRSAEGPGRNPANGPGRQPELGPAAGTEVRKRRRRPRSRSPRPRARVRRPEVWRRAAGWWVRAPVPRATAGGRSASASARRGPACPDRWGDRARPRPRPLPRPRCSVRARPPGHDRASRAVPPAPPTARPRRTAGRRCLASLGPGTARSSRGNGSRVPARRPPGRRPCSPPAPAAPGATSPRRRRHSCSPRAAARRTGPARRPRTGRAPGALLPVHGTGTPGERGGRGVPGTRGTFAGRGGTGVRTADACTGQRPRRAPGHGRAVRPPEGRHPRPRRERDGPGAVPRAPPRALRPARRSPPERARPPAPAPTRHPYAPAGACPYPRAGRHP